MESLPENRPLVWSLAVSLLAIVGLLLGSSPDFNSQFGLVDIPVEVSGPVGVAPGLSLGSSAGTQLTSAPCPTVQAGHRPGPAPGLLPGAPGRPCPAVLPGDPEAESAFLRWQCWHLLPMLVPPGRSPKREHCPCGEAGLAFPPGLSCAGTAPQPPEGLAGRTSPGPAPLVNKAASTILRGPASTSVCTTEGVVAGLCGH